MAVASAVGGRSSVPRFRSPAGYGPLYARCRRRRVRCSIPQYLREGHEQGCSLLFVLTPAAHQEAGQGNQLCGHPRTHERNYYDNASSSECCHNPPPTCWPSDAAMVARMTAGYSSQSASTFQPSELICSLPATTIVVEDRNTCLDALALRWISGPRHWRGPTCCRWLGSQCLWASSHQAIADLEELVC
jgi:hypothetical protein